MKITESRIRRIIREELLKESPIDIPGLTGVQMDPVAQADRERTGTAAHMRDQMSNTYTLGDLLFDLVEESVEFVLDLAEARIELQANIALAIQAEPNSKERSKYLTDATNNATELAVGILWWYGPGLVFRGLGAATRRTMNKIKSVKARNGLPLDPPTAADQQALIQFRSEVLTDELILTTRSASTREKLQKSADLVDDAIEANRKYSYKKPSSSTKGTSRASDPLSRHYVGNRELSKSGITIDSILSHGEEATVWVGKMDSVPGEVVIKVLDRPRSISGNAPGGVGALKAAAWRMENASRLPAELAERIPKVHKMGKVKGPDGTKYDYFVEERLLNVPNVQSTMGGITRPVSARYTLGQTGEQISMISKDINMLSDFVKTRYNSSRFTAGLDDLMRQLGLPLEQNIPSLTVKYASNPNAIPGSIRKKLDDIDYDNIDIPIFTDGDFGAVDKMALSLFPNEVKTMLRAQYAAEVQVQRSLAREISSRSVDELASAGVDVTPLQNLNRFVRDPAGDRIKHMAKNHTVALRMNPPIQSSRGQTGSLSRDLDPVIGDSFNFNRELCRRGFCIGDVHGGNVGITRSDGHITSWDFGGYQIKSPGDTVTFAGEKMTVAPVNMPLLSPMRRPTGEPIVPEIWLRIAGLI